MSSASRFILPSFQVGTSAGVPLTGAQLFFYTSGTSTKRNTYSESTLTTANTNPVVLDSAGYTGDIFLTPGVDYKVVLAPSTDTDPPTAPIYTWDPVGSGVTVDSHYATRTLAIAASIGAGINYIVTAGYTSTGDGGGGLYKRVGSEPSHAGKFQSADGAWWELADQIVYCAQLGAKLDGSTDDTTAINNALAIGRETCLGYGTSVISGPILITTDGQRFFGFGGLSIIKASAGNHNGIAIPVGTKYVTVESLTLKGISTTEPTHGTCAVIGGALSDGTGPTPTTDNLGGHKIRDLRITGVTPGTNGWNNGIRMFEVSDCLIEDNRIDSLYGTSSGYGYGITGAGDRQIIRRNYVKSTITSQSRAGIYLSYTIDSSIEGNYVEGFRSGGILTSTQTSGDTGKNHFINNHVVGCAQGAFTDDASLYADYETPATSSGPDVVMVGNIVESSGRHGILVRGATNPIISNNIINGWSTATTGQYGMKIIASDDASVTSNKFYFAQTDTTSICLDLQQCARPFVAINTFRVTSARSAIRLNTTATATSNAMLLLNETSGTFDTSALENSTQSSSFAVTPGLVRSPGTYTAADTTPSVADGVNYLSITNTGATAITAFDDGIEGQILTLVFNDNYTTITYGTYLKLVGGSASFTGSANDTLVLINVGANIWLEITRSVN